MTVQEVLLKALSGEVHWFRAAEILGWSPRTLRRWRERYDEHGHSGLIDKRFLRPSKRRLPPGQLEHLLRLYRERYTGFNVRHFHQIAKREHGVTASYSFVKQALQAAGLVKKFRARGRLLLSSTYWRFAKPRWSPDGAKLAFSRWATRDNTLALAVLNTDGSGERLLTKPGYVDMQGSDWSKDGQAILGACRFSQSERYSTCLVSVSSANEADDSSVRIIASDPKRNLFNQRFSPDQRWITFLAHDLLSASTSTVYVTPAEGGDWRAITDGAWFDDKPRWGPDGRVLYFVSNRTGVANVWGRRFDNSTGTPIGEPFLVTSFRSAQFQLTPQTVRMDIAVTATHLLLPMSESRSEIWMLDHVDR